LLASSLQAHHSADNCLYNDGMVQVVTVIYLI